MNTKAIARISTAVMLAMLLTAALFTVLRDLTTTNFTYVPRTYVPIDWKAHRIETPIETKYREKPVLKLPDPVDRVISPPGTGDEKVIVDIVRPPVAELANDFGDGLGARSGTDHSAVPAIRVPPVYPPRALTQGTEGWVQLRFNIGSSGNVTNVEVVASEPGDIFDKAAADAVARWRYNPEVINGEAVERRGMETVLRFAITED